MGSDSMNIDLSPVPARAVPTKRSQPKQAKKQPKRAKKDIWTAENVLQNPKSPLAHVNLKVSSGRYAV